jgi:glyoxylase-like metal-dependent hydrolase (beta-lactamase superfamily II)
MKIEKDLKIFIYRRFLVNSYLVIKNQTAVLIDPGLNANTIETYLGEHKLKLLAIILTHAHYDHIGDTFTLAQKHQIKVYLHQDEKMIIEKYHFAKELNMQVYIDCSLIQYYATNELKIGNLSFDVLLLKGHTPGGVALKYHNYVFSGDTVFYDSIGRTDLALSDPTQMQKSLKFFLNHYNDND